jgi:hypothetical protein
MRTIVLGVAFILTWYVVLACLLVRRYGWPWAMVGVLLLFAAAHAHRLLRGRLSRAVRRARTYLALRADPALQGRVTAELDALLVDALELERALVTPE